VAKVAPACGAQVIAGVRRHEANVIRYTAVFAIVHWVCAALVGYFIWWRKSHGGIVGGGAEIICIFVAVQAAAAYFVRRENRLPTWPERRRFVLQSSCYVLLFGGLCLWLLPSPLPVLSRYGWLVAGAITLGLTALGFWASWPHALNSMTKYLERRTSSVA